MSSHCVTEFCRWASIALAFASACFWFAASFTKARKPDDCLGVEICYKDKNDRDVYIHATAKKQTKLNAIAAFLIGLSIVFEIVVLKLGSFQFPNFFSEPS